MRQHFDPRRLEVLVKLRSESALLAAEEFDAVAALKRADGDTAAEASELTVLSSMCLSLVIGG